MAKPNLYRRLLSLLANSGTSDLRRQVQFLKAENQILRSRLEVTIRTTPAERARLVKLGTPLGAAIRDLITIVSPRTFTRWVNGDKKRGRAIRRKPGRPRTPDDIRDMILRLARETDFGYIRIVGELKKLGITISRATVANLLKEHGFPVGPVRGEGTWDHFLTSHAKTLWACDFVSRKVLTYRGFVDAFVLVFIHIASRRIHVSPATTRPDAAWVIGQVDGFAKVITQATPTGRRRPILMRDRDSKYGLAFDEALREHGIRRQVLPHASPNLNAHSERVIQSLQSECLDRFIALGTDHLSYLAQEYADYYNRQRPHEV